MKTAKGYTLIELLVGITVLSIIFTIGYVGFREFSRRQELQGVVKLVLSDLKATQQKALSGEKPETQSCDQLDGYSFVLVDETEYNLIANCTNAARVIKTVNLTDKYPSLTITATYPTTTFKVLGQGTNLVNSNIVTFTSELTGTARAITIGVGGDIQ